MDLNIQNKNFLVTGASDGFGKSVAMALAIEGANVLAVARTEEKLVKLQQKYPERITVLVGDITDEDVIDKLVTNIGEIDGVFLNAGGPPATSFMETEINDWDEAYKLIIRWKVLLIKALMPMFVNSQYGRILLLESLSVKQPIKNLVLSNSLRMSVVGFAKTLADEVAANGVTINVLAPGYHDTSALDRIIAKQSEVNNISKMEAKSLIEKQVPVNAIGNPDDLASLAIWLLSPVAGYITGQTISVDGGVVKSVFG